KLYPNRHRSRRELCVPRLGRAIDFQRSRPHVHWGLRPVPPMSTLIDLLLEQAGLPIPAVPTMLVAGAVAGMTQSSIVALVLVAVAGAVIADTFWYFTGRRIGMRVLRVLCRV